MVLFGLRMSKPACADYFERDSGCYGLYIQKENVSVQGSEVCPMFTHTHNLSCTSWWQYII